VTVPGGWRINVGRAGHRVRYVLPAPDDEALAVLGSRQPIPGTWIKVAADPDYLRNALPAAWTMSDTGYLMTTSFTGTAVAPSVPYALRISTVDGVVVAAYLDARGEIAASGRLAPAGSIGVIDQVETSAAHRRRGLGSAVMHSLSRHASESGLHTGVLVATDDGRELYRTLGWRVRSLIAVAHLPEPDADRADPPSVLSA
jgi:ribosomal protein S18 acetylase RimI-like enzyme